MKQNSRIMETYGLWIIDLICIAGTYLLATWLRFHNFRDMGVRETHFMTCVILMLCSTAYSFFFDWNREYLKRGFLVELFAVVRHNLFIIVVTIVLLYVFKWDPSRLTLGLFAVLNPVLSYLLHVLVKRVMYAYLRSENRNEKVLVVAESEIAARTIRRLKGQLDVVYDIAGLCLIDGDHTGETVEDVPVLCDRAHLLKTAMPMALDAVFIHTPEHTQKQLGDILLGFDEMGVNCNYVLELPSLDAASCEVGQFGDYSVLTYTRFHSSYKRLMIKRLVDILGGLVGLLITALLTPFIAIAIKADSKGPVFFSQVRIGKNGRRFRIYKFRSMRMDAERELQKLRDQNEVSGPMFKMEHDPRITKVGAFLRKTSLDELPQFWNIVKGEMSLVGTRPPTEEEFEKYTRYYRRRISMTPGLTGLWQVSGRNDIHDFDDVVKLDLRYIDDWSLTLDFKILFKTVVVVLTRRGAK